MTKPKRYKRFSSEFKRESIMRASEEGMTDKVVSGELRVSSRQFRRWRDELAVLGKESFLVLASRVIKNWKRELAQIIKERDFLKEAAAYFAKQLA